MDDLIKRAEDWINADWNSPIIGQGTDIMLALLERVRELEEQLKAQQSCAEDWYKQAEKALSDYKRLEAALEQIANQAVEPAYCYEIADRWHKIARKALGRGEG